jgi:hypothetical protein
MLVSLNAFGKPHFCERYAERMFGFDGEARKPLGNGSETFFLLGSEPLILVRGAPRASCAPWLRPISPFAK